MGKLTDMINHLFFEEVEIETEYDEKTNKVKNKATRVIKKEEKKEIPVKTISEKVKEEKPKVEKPIEKNTNESTFLNVSSNQNKEVKTVEKKEKEAYIPSNVISPIYGDNKGSYVTVKNSSLEVEDVENRKSIIGTVFSPINGDGKNIEVDKSEPIDEKIAAMTIDDFIVSSKTNEKNNHPLPPMTKKEFQYKPLDEALKAEKPSESKKESLTIENLSLFD